MQVSMVYRYSDTDRGDPKKSEVRLSRFHFVKHKSHMERPPWSEADEWRSNPRRGQETNNRCRKLCREALGQLDPARGMGSF